ncbi:MAG: glycosyltransferase [Chloroflexota bacterium]|nr:glycosyltransferase [Chloroflexota bacterium]
MPKLQTLLIVSHVVHYQWETQLYAYGPYAREVDIWADLFPCVIIAAPCRHAPPPGDALAFTRTNIVIRTQRERGGETLCAKLIQIGCLPLLVWDLAWAMYRADAIHVRCPGNLGLLGVLLAPLFSRYLVAKYAGQWNGYKGEPWTVRLQRRVLRSAWWRGPVTVYGHWQTQPRQIVSFFTSMLTTAQVAHATVIAQHKHIETPLRLLFSGRLVPEKRVESLLEAVKICIVNGLQIELVIVGTGSESLRLHTQAVALAIDRSVTFVGALPFDKALRWYEWAHCLVLPSIHSEGWPKVVAEGMAYGLLCIAVAHGQLPTMLTERGILLQTGSAQELATAIQRIAAQPEAYRSMRQTAYQWAAQYSLEGLRSALRTLLETHWGVTLDSLVEREKAVCRDPHLIEQDVTHL